MLCFSRHPDLITGRGSNARWVYVCANKGLTVATISGFQANSTIHAAFWIYKPDPTIDPVSKEQIVEVNSIQKVEANAAVILSSISSTQVASNVLTITVATSAGMRPYQRVILSGLTNSTFLNGQVVTINAVTPTTFTANFPNANYGPTAEPAGALVTDTTNRTAYLFYPEQAVAPSQAPLKLEGAIASRFLYDLETLFY
jgi:hypothetical protein